MAWCAGSGSTPPRSPLKGSAQGAGAFSPTLGSQPLLSEGDVRPRVTKLKASQSAPEGPAVLALQQQQQSPQHGWCGSAIPAATAAAAAAAGDSGQEQQSGGLQQLASATIADEFESFADASEQPASESSSSSTGAPGEAEQHSSASSSEQLPLPYTEAELGAMIGGTLNRQYWESIHDGAGSVRDVYSIRGPHYLRDRKKVPAGEPSGRPDAFTMV